MATLYPPDSDTRELADSTYSKPSSIAPSTEKAPADPTRRNGDRRRKRRQRLYIAAVVASLLFLLAIVIPVAVVLSGEDSSSTKSDASSSSASDSGNDAHHSKSPEDHEKKSPYGVPSKYMGTYLDPATWYDKTDFNTTFTDRTVGGLYVMGLYDDWDDTTQANDGVPALNEEWGYGTTIFRGTNMGGLLTLEPFLTPSVWDTYPGSLGLIDEWTLAKHLGPEKAKSTFEKVYAGFASKKDFQDIAAAGFDHVRIPFSYWAVKVYDDEPYVPEVSFRYLLRAIEWARESGLRVFLDLHAVPGSQNGWTHSGRVGDIGWLKGPDGDLNGQRSLDITKQLATFFAQPRYKNVVTMYGLVNEPQMPDIGIGKVIDWYNKAIPIIRDAGFNGLLIISNGFLSAEQWGEEKGKMQDVEGVVMDIHQYAVYDEALLSLNHTAKVDYACNGWSEQADDWADQAAGFGPSMYGEWSYADTECALYQNGVAVGSRWNGTYDKSDPMCPLEDKSKCDCTDAISDPKDMSEEYKAWLRTYFYAQMDSFSNGWGWFHWTWKSEEYGVAPSWTYKDGMAAGIVPKTIQTVTWDCTMDIPDYASEGLSEAY